MVVVLPDPVRPQTPIFYLAWIVSVKPRSAGGREGRYLTVTWSNSTLPCSGQAGGRSLSPGFEDGASAGRCEYCKTRWTETIPFSSSALDVTSQLRMSSSSSIAVSDSPARPPEMSFVTRHAVAVAANMHTGSMRNRVACIGKHISNYDRQHH